MTHLKPAVFAVAPASAFQNQMRKEIGGDAADSVPLLMVRSLNIIIECVEDPLPSACPGITSDNNMPMLRD